jgi:hypothetical protein
MNDRALPHIGRDAVKIGSPDGATATFVVRGQLRSHRIDTRNRGLADDSHTF